MLPLDILPGALQQVLPWMPILNARFLLGAIHTPAFTAGPDHWLPIGVNLAVGLALLYAAIHWFKAKFLH